MSIYIPPAFAGDASDATRLIRDYPFATLMTSGSAGQHISHVPLLLQADCLIGHVARANPHWQHFAGSDTVAVFHGPHAFVSAGWYAEPQHNVPTWNFCTVHVHGRPELLDAEGTLRAVRDLAQRFDGQMHTEAQRVVEMLKGIVAFRMPVAQMEIKCKMSQNKLKADRELIKAGLRAVGQPQETAVADWMEQHDRD